MAEAVATDLTAAELREIPRERANAELAEVPKLEKAITTHIHPVKGTLTLPVFRTRSGIGTVIPLLDLAIHVRAIDPLRLRESVERALEIVNTANRLASNLGQRLIDILRDCMTGTDVVHLSEIDDEALTNPDAWPSTQDDLP